MSFLPEKDNEYLRVKGLSFEECSDGSQKILILKSCPLPPERFDSSLADVLIMLPQGFPDIGPDMFYTLPWLRLRGKGCYPRAADQPFNFRGQTWQRWSRHSNEWRPGRDGIRTVLKRVEHAFESA